MRKFYLKYVLLMVFTLWSAVVFSVNTNDIVISNNYDNLWHYIDSMAKLKFDKKHTKDYIKWFEKHPDYLTRISGRANLYLYLIVKKVEAKNMPIELALLPVVESAFYPFSHSSEAATGLWQFISSTGRFYNLEQNWWYDARRDVEASTDAALLYLQDLYNLFDKDWVLAVAAYNAGQGRVKRAIKKNKALGKPTDFWSLNLPAETKSYVPKLFAVREIIKNPNKYGQKLLPIKNKPTVGIVILKSQLDVKKIGELSGVSIDELYNLNPGIRRWITPPMDNYKLLLPIYAIPKFKKNLSTLPLLSQLEWIRHKISKDEDLSDIASTYGIEEQHLQNINKLHRSVLTSGDFVIVPLLKHYKSYHSLSKEERVKRLEQQKQADHIKHNIVSGDSLWKIARYYEVKISDIILWNNITNANLIKYGNTIVINKKYDINESLVDVDITTEISITRKVLYNIKKHDTLSEIAEQFNISVAGIKKWNKLSSDVIKYGANLVLYINMVK